MANVGELLKDHVTLEVECLDRIYLNGYIPQLQLPGQLISFLIRHRKQKVASPVLLQKITKSFLQDVERYAEENDIPIVHFERGQRKDDIAAKMRRERSVEDGVVFIGIAQEKAYAFKGRKKVMNGYVEFEYSRQSVFVNHYYFYIQDRDFGPCFIKICSYAPFAVKVCLNGHEWAKRQMQVRGIEYESLDNGFLSCVDPEELQRVCDTLSEIHIEIFFHRWMEKLPNPMTAQDRRAGYHHQLSVWQAEISLTQVFDRPLRGREFFEEVIRDNLDQGRPDRVQLLFDRRITRRTPGRFRSRVIQHGVHPSIHIDYKSSHVKQYFKENRALRTETTINNPRDFGIAKNIRHLSHLQLIGRSINRRLLDVQRVSQSCGLSGESIDRIVHFTITKDGHRASGLKLGDPRVSALFSSLASFTNLIHGFRNADLRKQMQALLDVEYKSTMMTYDLRRLRRKGIIFRLPKSNRYVLTTYGWKVCRFFTRLNARIFHPGYLAITTDETDLFPQTLRKAFHTADREIDRLIEYGIGVKHVA